MALKERHKNCSIDVLAPQWSLALMERMPEVRKAIVMPMGHGQFNFKGRKNLGLSLRDEAYDEAIVLPNSWKSEIGRAHV